MALVEHISWAELKGTRPSQEDAVVIIENFLGSSRRQFFGVFDGHRGNSAALYSAGHLSRILQGHLEGDKYPPIALADSFEECHKQIALSVPPSFPPNRHLF